MNFSGITIASHQGNARYADISHALTSIQKSILWAETESVDILCFPECFLQGYVLDEKRARKLSLNLNSQEFSNILQALYSDTTTIILGLIERQEANIYNTAVVIEQGKLIGKYRKQHLLDKENFFTKGNHSPLFEKLGIKYGINICSDTRFSESVKEMSRKGVRVLFFPLNNSLPHDIADKWKDKHVPYWVERAKETSCWVLTSDVIEKSDTNTGYGFTTLIDPNGSVIQQLEYLKEGNLKYRISNLQLHL